MKIFPWILFLGLAFHIGSAYGQAGNEIQDSCSKLIKDIEFSYFWKIDSLGTNGFRYISASKFKNCKLDKITKQNIIEHLGIPNQITEKSFFIPGDIYMYYTLDFTKLDYSKLPESYGLWACIYVAFKFDSKNEIVVDITFGDLDK